MSALAERTRRLRPRRLLRRTCGLARHVVKRAKASPRRLRKRWQRARRRIRRVYDMRRRPTYTRTLALVPSRDEIPELLNRRGLVGIGAEIGVKVGKYSDFILSRWRGEKLISIDPWLEAEAEEYVDRANVSQQEHERFYEETRRRLEKYGERSEIWRMTSVEAAARLPDSTLDFVYIDARHDYDSVKEDLEAWYRKVRPGGIIAGHDYADGLFPQGNFGVKRAVDEFFGAAGLAVCSTEGRWPVEMFPSWLVEVPASPESMSGEPTAARLQSG